MLKKIESIAAIFANKFNTEIEEIYDEAEESDAGFELKNGVCFQLAPYTNEPYIVSFWDDIKKVSIGISSYRAEDAMLSSFEEIEKRFGELILKNIIVDVEGAEDIVVLTVLPEATLEFLNQELVGQYDFENAIKNEKLTSEQIADVDYLKQRLQFWRDNDLIQSSNEDFKKILKYFENKIEWIAYEDYHGIYNCQLKDGRFAVIGRMDEDLCADMHACEKNAMNGSDSIDSVTISK